MQKYFRLRSTQISSLIRTVPSHRGALRTSRNAGRDAVDAAVSGEQQRAGRMMPKRTAKSCRSDAPMQASSLREAAQATVSNKPGHRGEHEVSRKTIARGMPGRSGVTVVTTLVCLFFCTRGCGCIARPAFPAPSDIRGRNVFGKPRADRAARSRNCALNWATQKHSSCPGLTRASIYFGRAFSKQMDCRVKSGNDILMRE